MAVTNVVAKNANKTVNTCRIKATRASLRESEGERGSEGGLRIRIFHYQLLHSHQEK